MRYLSVAAAAAMTLLTVSTAVHGQRPDSAIAVRSLEWVAKGKVAQAAGNLDGASDAFESALAIDPRNRAGFIGLGEIARVRGLPGKAIRFYREALELQPDDIAALTEQGEALVQQGAVDRATGNLTKLRAICGKKICPEIGQLAAVIAKGPPVVTASAKSPASETKN